MTPEARNKQQRAIGIGLPGHAANAEYGATGLVGGL